MRACICHVGGERRKGWLECLGSKINPTQEMCRIAYFRSGPANLGISNSQKLGRKKKGNVASGLPQGRGTRKKRKDYGVRRRAFGSVTQLPLLRRKEIIPVNLMIGSNNKDLNYQTSAGKIRSERE